MEGSNDLKTSWNGLIWRNNRRNFETNTANIQKQDSVMLIKNFPTLKITPYFTNNLLSRQESILKRTTRDLRRWRHLLSGEQISRLDLLGGGRNGPRTVTLFGAMYKWRLLYFRDFGPLPPLISTKFTQPPFIWSGFSQPPSSPSGHMYLQC